MLIRRFSILSIALFSISLALAAALFHAKTPAYAQPLIDPMITSALK
ncbi:hypothetical protein [Bartonella sp. LJL80]